MVRFLASLTLAVAALAVGSASFTSAPDHQSPSLEIPVVAGIGPSSPDELTTIGEMLVTAEWFDQIFRGGPNNNEPGSRLGLEAPPREAGDRPKRASGTYRTLCVRVCDGFYFPISYSTSRDRFASDAKQCEHRCPTRSRLFVHRNPGEDVDDMVDLKGRLYRSLPTALLYRTQYVADCTCRGLPWDKEAIARHRVYAEAAKQTIPTKNAHRTPITAVRATESAARPQR